MPIANCKRCGRIYNRVRRDICPNCIEEEDQLYLKVREFLRENRDASLEEVVKATEIPMQTLIQMIQDGRIMLRDNPNMAYPCERCGSLTQSGRYCMKCTKEIANSLSQAGTQMRDKLIADKKAGRGYYSE